LSTNRAPGRTDFLSVRCECAGNLLEKPVNSKLKRDEPDRTEADLRSGASNVNRFQERVTFAHYSSLTTATPLAEASTTAERSVRLPSSSTLKMERCEV